LHDAAIQIKHPPYKCDNRTYQNLLSYANHFYIQATRATFVLLAISLRLHSFIDETSTLYVTS